ncbi:hypothetical protein IWQ55_006640 [Labrenzia sp. EL_208]|nr:hypothetical protein [Labrenzia sp. EL_132]MBG6233398.1 hypothetical protein [Labrenzia sp. EL_208]
MNSALRRLSRLEQKLDAAGGQLVVVRSGPNDADVDDVLRENGIDRDDPKNQIIVFKTLYENKDGSIEPGFPKAEMVYSKPLSKRVA